MAKLDELIGNTPLVDLSPLLGGAQQGRVEVLAKMEGNNPGGSVKDRAALAMIRGAEERGEIHPGDRIIEATSGNTGIALAMIAASRGYRMTLVMPDTMTVERRAAMAAYGADFVLTPGAASMETPGSNSSSVSMRLTCGLIASSAPRAFRTKPGGVFSSASPENQKSHSRRQT